MAYAACVGGAFVVVAVTVQATGGNLADVAGGWVTGAFGTPSNFTQTLVYATPLVLIALGASVPWRAGVIPLGAEGQLVAGAIAAAFVALSPIGTSPLALPLGALAGIAGGAVWALIPALAQVRWGVPEILTGLIANYLVVPLLGYLLRTTLNGGPGTATAQSAQLPGASLIPALPVPGRLSGAVLLALVLVLPAMWWHRSRPAFLLDVYRTRPWLAARHDVGPARAIVTTTVISGAAAGLAGWTQLAGVDGRLHLGISGGIGFSGLVVLVLGRSRPLPIVFAAILYASLKTGADGVQIATGIPAAIGSVTQAVVLTAAALAVVLAHRRAARAAAVSASG